MDPNDPLWLPEDSSSVEGEIIDPVGVNNARGGKWSPAMAERVIEIVAECGSPSIAAKRLGIKPATIQHHRRVNPEFRARYDEAMRQAVESLVANSIARASDVADPSNEALTLAWLRLRGDRINAYLDGEGDRRTDAVGLDPKVVELLEPDDRRELLRLLTKYLEVQNARALPKP
jgi:hypothetical protein